MNPTPETDQQTASSPKPEQLTAPTRGDDERGHPEELRETRPQNGPEMNPGHVDQ